MHPSVSRKSTKVFPYPGRVVARYFENGPARAKTIIEKVNAMPEQEIEKYFIQVLREFSKRHRNITRIFTRHAKRLHPYFEELHINYNKLDNHRLLLIGSYFTMEYAIESAAFFNPSMVEDIDQSGLEEGQKRVIISFRAVGEGHISSIVFCRGVIDQQGDIHLQDIGKYIDE